MLGLPQQPPGITGGGGLAMSLGTSSHVGGTDSLRSAAAVGNQPPARMSREGQGEAREQHAGRFLCRGRRDACLP